MVLLAEVLCASSAVSWKWNTCVSNSNENEVVDCFSVAIQWGKGHKGKKPDKALDITIWLTLS